MPSTFESTERLFRLGRYVEILANTGSSDRDLSAFTQHHRVLIAQTLLQAGHVRRAAELAAREVSSSATATLRAQCEIIQGIACRHSAQLGRALQHYHAAMQAALDQRDHVQQGWAILQRFRLLAELHPASQLVPLLSDVRRCVTKAGDAHLAAYMHDAVALMEASSGRPQEARRHLDLSRSLIRTAPNAWLDQLNWIGYSFVDLLECNYHRAISSLNEARRLIAIVGVRERPVIECNHGHALLVTGRFEAAMEHFRAAVTHSGGFARLGAIDGMARAYLATGKLNECQTALDSHDEFAAADDRLPSAFAGRCIATTRVRLLLARRDFENAAQVAEKFLNRADALHDRLLKAELTCVLAESLLRLNRAADAASILFAARCGADSQVVEQQPGYYRVVGHVLAPIDSQLSNAMHFRAKSLWTSQGNTHEASAGGVIALAQSNNAVQDDRAKAAALVTTISSALALGANPRLLGEELASAIRVLDCSANVRIASSRPITPSLRGNERDFILPLHATGEPVLALVCERPTETFKTLLLAEILRIGQVAVALAKFRAGERARAALWPADAVEEQGGALFVAEEMQGLLAVARRVAATTVPVLITGETGTGKEILARTIHGYSNRARAAFLPFNCTSTPKDMLDSQLFGHRRGSFTGAVDNFPGIIRAAAGGTLFLDEIGDMPLDMQPKLLRFLESGDVHPIGETLPVRVDVRVIAATNANLDTLVAEGRFREDLFYRLNIVRLHVPPLRERRVEVPALANHYLQKCAQEYAKGDLRLAEETMEYLLLYRWPGNVRQLANEMRRMAALAETGAVLMPEHLSPEIAASRRTLPPSERTLDPTEVVVRLDQPMAAATEHLERTMVQYALHKCGGRMEETAAMLGLSRKGLYLKRLRFGIDAPEGPEAIEVA